MQEKVKQSRATKLGNMYLLKVSKRNSRKRHEICSKFTIKTQERCKCFNVNFEQISHHFLVILLLTLNK